MSVSSARQFPGPYVVTSTTRPASPYVGQMIFESDTGATYIWWNGAWVLQITPGGSRNAILNGGFDVVQRGYTPVTAANAYSADQWITFASGDTHRTYPILFIPGNAIAGQEPVNYLRTEVTANAGAGNYVIEGQRIEDVRKFAGQVVTISFWAKASVAKSIAIEIVQSFGTGGSPSADVTTFVAKLALTTSWVRYSASITVPSISGKTIGTNSSYLGLNLWYDAGSTFNARTGTIGQLSANIDLWGVQLEAGPVVSPFERRSYGAELALCQRYFYAITSLGVDSVFAIGWAYSTTNATIHVFHPVEMRATPIITAFGSAASAYELTDWTLSAACTALAINGAATDLPTFTLLIATVAAGLTQFRPYALRVGASAATLSFSAEL